MRASLQMTKESFGIHSKIVAPSRREALAEVAYGQTIQPGPGTKFLDAVEDATARALAFLLNGSPAPYGTRGACLKDLPFAHIDRPDDQGITVNTLGADLQ